MRARGLLAVALLSLFASRAAAQHELPEVAFLHVEPCDAPELAPAALRERLRVELTSDGVRDVRLVEGPDAALAGEGSGLAVIRIAAAPCAAESATFRVAIEDLLTQKRVERIVDLSEAVAEDRARVLALLIAELLRASWMELSLEDPPPHAPANVVEALRVRWRAREAAQAPSTTTDDARAPSTAITAAFAVRALPGANGAPLGGRLALDLAPIRELVLRIDAEVVYGTSTHPIGAIDVGLATLGLTAAWVAPIGDVLLSLGPRVSGGVSWAAGRSNDPSATTSSGAGPVLMAGGALEIDVRLVPGLSLRFGAEASGVILGFEARVASVPAAGVYGAVLGAWTGVAIAP